MPRFRKGDEALKATGTARADRLRGPTPTPSGLIGDAPSHLPPNVAEVWNELVAICPPRVLTSADRPHVEITARLLADIRAGQYKLSSFRVLDTLLGRMGLNPQARGTVTAAPEAEPEDEWAEFQ